MPAQPSPQPSAPELSGKPTQPPADAPPSGLGAAAAEPAQKDTLFHLLLGRGWSPEVAYTAEQRIRAMTSEIAAAGLQPVLAELRQMRETMATKADLAGLTTNLDKTETNLRREMAERETRLIKWMFGAMLAQTAVIVGIVVGVVPLLK